MSIYYVIFADTADTSVSVTNATYSTVRNSTAATGSGSALLGVGQSPTYTIGQYFARFDTSSVPSGVGTGVFSFAVSTAAAAGDNLELRQVSANSNKIAGGSLSSHTPLLGSIACPTVGSTRYDLAIADISGMSRSATLNLLLHSENERLNVAPSSDNRPVVNFADQTGTTSDPYLSLLLGSGWQLVGIGNSVEVTGTSHALVTTGISGLQSGDLLVACISSRIASTTSITLPSGGEWTLVSEQKNDNTATNTSATPSGLMAYCVRGGSDPNLTFTHPTSPSVAIGRIIAYRNVDAGSPLDQSNSVTSGTNVTAINVAAGVTTTQDDDLLVCLRAGGQESTMTSWAAATDPTSASGSTNTSSHPAPNAWLERCDDVTTTGADTALSIFDAVKTAAGSTGNMTGTASQGSAHVVVAGAFKLVASGGGGGAAVYRPRLIGGPLAGRSILLGRLVQ